MGMDTKRFNTPEYKRQIKAVRNYHRQVPQKPETPAGKFFYLFGLQSNFSKVIVMIVLLLLVYLVYFAKFLKISEYEITGVDAPAQQLVLKHLNAYEGGSRFFMPQRNILFFSTAGFSQYLLTKDPQIAKVNSIKKSFWQKLIINLDQRIPAFLLSTNGQNYIINSDGTVAPVVDSTQYPVIMDTLSDNILPGEHFFSDKQSFFLKFIGDNFQKQIAVGIKSYELPGKASEQLIVYTDKGFKVFFTDTTDPKEYLQRLATLWQQLTSDQQNRLAYFDLRFQKNAYSCLKTDPCAQ